MSDRADIPRGGPRILFERFSEPEKVSIIRSMVAFTPIVRPDFEDKLREDSALKKLLDNPPTLSGKATEELDGRRVPVVIVLVRDKNGATRRGILVRLLVDDQLRDHSRTNPRGIVLLRLMSHRHDHEHHHLDLPENTVVEMLVPGLDVVREEVSIPEGSQHTVLEIVVDSFPDPGREPEEEDENGDGSSAAPPETETETQPRVLLASTAGVELSQWDNPLERLPADFSTELCADLLSLLGPTEDPILGLVQQTSDFRTRRTPLIKRLVIPRIGEPPPEGGPPRRYFVRVRQEWTFLGYTLGELAGVDALDPGQVVEETSESVRRTVDRISRSMDQFVSRTTSLTRSNLSELSSVDSLLEVTTSARARAAAGGFGLALGPIVLGAVGGGARVSATATTRSRIATSLEVNSSLHTATTLINQTVRSALSSLRDVESTITKAIGQVSPLLSRVTNLLRWVLYENYVVCTAIEDIVEVQSVQITTLGDPDTPLFTDDEIAIEYRRIFEPQLLEPRLRPHFNVLSRAVAAKRAAGMPVSQIHVIVDFAAAVIGGTLRVGFGGEEVFLTLRPGATRAYGSLRLPDPARPSTDPTTLGSVGTANLELSPRTDLASTSFFPILNLGRVTVSGVTFRFEATPGAFSQQRENFGSTFTVQADSAAASQSIPLRVPVPAVFTEFDPLFLHVNRNRTYYFGLLAQTALYEPALRDDAPQLSSFDGDHPLWRLPIVGFEGDRVLVISDVDETDPDVQPFFDDEGAATVIQIGALGAYGEALQGLLQLDDAAGLLHPQLLPAPAPVMPPIALVDLTGKQLQIVDGADGGTLPGGGGGIVPPLP